MMRSTFGKILFILFGILLTNSAIAMWQVKATWQIGGAAPVYYAVGSSQDDALANARSACADGQSLEQNKLYCVLNAPTRVEFTEFPDGPYTRSCDRCRIEANKLVCNLCKPKIERRELDLKQCTSEGLKQIENCNGDLHCSPCPASAPPTVPTGPARTFRGVCDKYGKDCKQQP